MSGVNSRSAGQQWAGFASIGAGIIHGAAIGLHAEHAASSRVFLVLTLLQVGWGVLALSNVKATTFWLGTIINGGAVIGWAFTRAYGISFISGLEIPESPQPADTVCAVLGVIAVAASMWALRRPEQRATRITTTNAAYV